MDTHISVCIYIYIYRFVYYPIQNSHGKSIHHFQIISLGSSRVPMATPKAKLLLAAGPSAHVARQWDVSALRFLDRRTWKTTWFIWCICMIFFFVTSSVNRMFWNWEHPLVCPIYRIEMESHMQQHPKKIWRSWKRGKEPWHSYGYHVKLSKATLTMGYDGIWRDISSQRFARGLARNCICSMGTIQSSLFSDDPNGTM